MATEKSGRDVTRRRFLGTAGAVAIGTALAPIGRRGSALAQPSFDYYIGPAGSDSNPGTLSQPWAITALETKPQIAGRRVGLLDGLYRVGSYPSSNPGSGSNPAFVWISASGSSGAPTIVEAVNRGQAVLTTRMANGSYPQVQTFALGIIGNFVTVRGLKITDLAFDAIKVSSDNVLIENCEISDIASSRRPNDGQAENLGGITTGDGADAKNLRIRNCIIHDIYNQNQYNSCVGNLYDSGNTLIVEFCTFYNAGAACYPKNRTGSLTFRYNFVYACRGGLGTPWAVNTGKFSGSEVNYHNNLVIGQTQHGGTGFQQGQVIAQTWNYYNNTFVQDSNDGSGCTYLPIESSWNSSCRMSHYNNIYDSRGRATQGIFIASSAASAAQIFTMTDFNLFNPVATNLQGGGSASTLSQWQALVQGRDANSLTGAPTYTVGNGLVPANYRLAAGSRGVNAGRIGGTLAGALTDLGCWGGGATRIGADFAATKVPEAPVLTSVV